MSQHQFSRTAFLAFGLFTITWLVLPGGAVAADEIDVPGPDSSLTPVPGSRVRRAVLDALRQEVKRLQGLEVVFVVVHLKVKDRWAWAHTRPQSPDATERYEDVSALLNLRDGVWVVVELPCTEVENPECLDEPGYFVKLKKRFPGIPAEVLPVLPDGLKD